MFGKGRSGRGLGWWWWKRRKKSGGGGGGGGGREKRFLINLSTPCTEFFTRLTNTSSLSHKPHTHTCIHIHKHSVFMSLAFPTFPRP